LQTQEPFSYERYAIEFMPNPLLESWANTTAFEVSIQYSGEEAAE
jgi:hypothetical protein